MASPGLRSGAGKPFTTKGLRSHDGTNLVAVYIHVSHPHPPSDLVNRAFNAGMKAKRKSKPRCIQGITDFGHAVAGKAHHVQDWPEYFTFQ